MKVERRTEAGVWVAPVPVIGSSKCSAHILSYSRNQNLCGIHAAKVLPPDILSVGCYPFYRTPRTPRFPPQSHPYPYLRPTAYHTFHPIHSQHCEEIINEEVATTTTEHLIPLPTPSLSTHSPSHPTPLQNIESIWGSHTDAQRGMGLWKEGMRLRRVC